MPCWYLSHDKIEATLATTLPLRSRCRVACKFGSQRTLILCHDFLFLALWYMREHPHGSGKVFTNRRCSVAQCSSRSGQEPCARTRCSTWDACHFILSAAIYLVIIDACGCMMLFRLWFSFVHVQERVAQQNRIGNLLDGSMERSIGLHEIYEDKDGAAREEVSFLVENPHGNI